MMTASFPALDDFELIARYTDQPSRLPAAARAAAARLSCDTNVIAYALIDLDEQLQLNESWLVLTQRSLVYLLADQAPFAAARKAVTSCAVERGVSCNTLRVDLGGETSPLLARYTQRQSSSVERIVALLEGDSIEAENIEAESIEAENIEADGLEADSLEAEPGEHAAVGNDPDTAGPDTAGSDTAGSDTTGSDTAGSDTVGPDTADARYAAEVVRPLRDAQALVSRNGVFIIARLLRYLLPYRRQLTIGLGAAALITLCALVPPYLTGYLIDGVLRPAQSGELRREDASYIAWLCVAAMAAVYVLRRAAAWVRLRLMAVLGELVARDLRQELYAHLQQLSISFYSRKKTGSLITRVSSDTDRLWDFVAFGIVDLSLGLVMLIGLCAVLISMDLTLGLLMALPLPALGFAIHKNHQRMERMFTRAFRRWSNLTDVLSDTIPGIRVVRAFNQHAREGARFRSANEAATDDFNHIHTVWTAFWPGVMLSVELAIILVWMFALPRLLGQELLGPPLSIGTFVSFLLYTGMFMWPIEVLGQMARIVNRATTSAQRVFEVLDTKPEVVDPAHPLAVTSLDGHVSFEDVSFSYDQVRPTLRRVSFQVRAGETIGLVGPSGGGKSTLVNLLTRFYDVSSGRILIDGVDLRKLDSGQYRRQVAMVLQDPYLFHGSVLDNIRYGMPEATLAQVVAAARVANAHDFVCKLPHGYDTLVGERGHTLSGGERQRISIARAVLSNPRILILDEATSAVDTETEQKIQEAMDRLARGRTVFAIAHRLSTLRRASRLFVIEDGRLTEQGTHPELIQKQDGTYRRLYQLQQQLQDPG